MSAVEKAVKCMPNARTAELAAACGVSYESVRKWRKNGVPADRCLQIEQITEGKVTRADLRPDLFGPISTAA